jgi:hypothetical protein
VVNWFFETGPDTYIFTEEESLTMDIMASPGISEFREHWKAANYQVPFSWNHTIDSRDGTSIDDLWIFATEHFIKPSLSHLGLGSKTAEGPIDTVGGTIGSLDRITVDKYDDQHVIIAVHNEMGWASGIRKPGTNKTYLQNRPRDAWGPGGTIWQVFIWIEPIPQ